MDVIFANKVVYGTETNVSSNHNSIQLYVSPVQQLISWMETINVKSKNKDVLNINKTFV